MQTIQIQEFNNISDQKIYLENIEYLKQHFNEILEISVISHSNKWGLILIKPQKY
jgi:hypothetical protein